MKHALLLALTALPLTAAAVDPIALYSFETADATTTPESVSAGANVATFGPAGSLAHNSRKLGTGSLRLRPEKANPALPDGDDGAMSSNNYTWATDTRTIAFWMRAATAQTDSLATMIGLGSGTTNGGRFDIRLNTGTGTSATTAPGADGLLRLEVQGGFVECTAADYTTANLGITTLRDAKWHHIAVVVPTATATVQSALFYIDGVSVPHTSQGTNQAINTAAGPLRIGDSYQDYARDFKGYLDDVRVYDIALTAQEVADLYQSGVTNASAIAAFEGDPELLGGGQSTALTWATTGAPTAISIDQGVGNVTGQTSTNATPTGSGVTTYTLSVTTPTGVETAALDITVLGPVAITSAALGASGFSLTAINLVPGRSYELQMSENMAEGSWGPLQVFTGPASTTQTFTDGVASSASDRTMFYRIVEAATE